jgi:hypothetical protein
MNIEINVVERDEYMVNHVFIIAPLSSIQSIIGSWSNIFSEWFLL